MPKTVVNSLPPVQEVQSSTPISSQALLICLPYRNGYPGYPGYLGKFIRELGDLGFSKNQCAAQRHG